MDLCGRGMIQEINLLELFSGIGGFTKGFQRAGYTIKKHYFSEIDKHAIANYKYNFKDAEYIGSVTDVRGRDIERPDIITFGSPCQDFSLAGKRAGLEGKRSNLVMEAIRLITETKPSVFIWENVKGSFSSNDGADFWAIIAAFANIGGYRLEWQLLNTSWVLPQNRERIYLVGHLAGRSEPGVFPFRTNDFKINELQGQQANTCTIKARHEADGNGSYIIERQQFSQNGLLVNSNTKQGYEIAEPGDSINFSVPTSKTRRGRVGKGTAQTLDTACNQGVIQIAHVSRTDEAKEIRKESMKNGKDFTPFQGKKLEWKESDVMNTVTCATQKDNLLNISNNIRRLTEIECERLQGFPDDWTKYGNYDGEIKKIAKTQRYKMIGNAVTVDIVKIIAERLKIT